MRRLRRFPYRSVLVLAVLAVVFGLPLAGAAGAVRPGAAAAAAPSAAAAATKGSVAAVTTAARQPAPQSGVCSVPGIGDIGSLLGFCQLGSSGLSGDLNNICQPSVPTPEPANAGIDAMVKPPASGKQPATLYGSYGIAGQYWAATNLQCSDMTSLIGNNVASMVFDIAKSIDRVTITVYQSAAGQGILGWLSSVVDKLISSLGNAIYFPYLALVVIIGAIWLAWQGLIRKRATRTIEGTVWMVVACAAAIWLIGRPGDFTGIGTSVSNGISQTLNVAFAKLPAPSQSNCLPVTSTDPQLQSANFNFSSGSGVVDQNANELWTVLVCKPWLAGEFGTTAFAARGAAPGPVNTYGRQLLWSQAIAMNEPPTTALIQAKQATYQGIAASIQKQSPGVYPLFQGKQWTTRLEIGFAALFAAAIAGVLVLLIAVTLILLKLGFLLLLVVGPFFLLIGTHPGFGRVVALRWFEMLIGVLLKQGAIALVLSVLLYAYSLIMGTSDAVLPWALKILMIALVTIAVFIYRKPFQHLFSAVGYGMIGSRERADIDLERARVTVRDRTAAAAAAVVPGMAGYRAARWARRSPVQAAGVAAGAAAAAGNGAATGLSAADAPGLDSENGYATLDGAGAGVAPQDGGRAGHRSALASRARARAAAGGGGTGRSAPPLNLPSRGETAAVAAGAAGAAAGAAGAAAGWARGNGSAAGAATSGQAAASADPTAVGEPARTAPPRPALPGTPRPGQAAPVRSQSPQSRPLQSPHVRAAAAAAGAAAAMSVPPAQMPASPAPASPPPPRPAPSGSAASGSAASGPAPARPASSGPAPSWPAASSPWRPGVTPRQSQVRPPSGPDPAPRSPAGRGPGGAWADSSAGRQAAPPARSSAPPPGSQVGPSPRPPSGPARPPSGPSAGSASAPSRQPTAGPSSAPLSRQAGPRAGQPAGPPSRQPSGPWAGEPSGPVPRQPAGPAPRQASGPAPRPSAAPPGRPPAPPAAGRPGAAPPRPSTAAPARQRGVAPGRQPGAAPARQRAVSPGGPPGAPPARRPGRADPPPGLPLTGNTDPAQPESPAPFWLRPLRRRK
jgi:hypothetical protein